MVWSLVSSLTSSAGANHRDKVPRSPVSPVHSPDSIRRCSDDLKVPAQSELAGPAKDVTPELPDVDFKGRAELPIDPERSLINSPKENPESPIGRMRAESTSSRESARGMGSNLNNGPEVGPATGAGGSIPHVLSWMSYDGDAGPQR